VNEFQDQEVSDERTIFLRRQFCFLPRRELFFSHAFDDLKNKKSIGKSIGFCATPPPKAARQVILAP
jgi:hypothetical protein